jgi:hypothetical protein
MSTTDRRELLARTPTRVEHFHYDFADEVGRIVETEDCGPITEAAKVMADQPPGKDFRHVAYVPTHVMDRAFREGWFNDPAAWKRWLNDPDNRAFRTGSGRV